MINVFCAESPCLRATILPDDVSTLRGSRGGKRCSCACVTNWARTIGNRCMWRTCYQTLLRNDSETFKSNPVGARVHKQLDAGPHCVRDTSLKVQCTRTTASSGSCEHGAVVRQLTCHSPRVVPPEHSAALTALLTAATSVDEPFGSALISALAALGPSTA